MYKGGSESAGFYLRFSIALSQFQRPWTYNITAFHTSIDRRARTGTRNPHLARLANIHLYPSQRLRRLQRTKQNALLQSPLLHGKSPNHGKQTLRLGPRGPKQTRLVIIEADTERLIRDPRTFCHEQRHIRRPTETATLDRRTHQTGTRTREGKPERTVEAC